MYENSTPTKAFVETAGENIVKDHSRPIETLSQLSEDFNNICQPLAQLTTFLCGYKDDFAKLFDNLQTPMQDSPSDKAPSLNDRITYLEEKAAIIKTILYKIAEDVL